MAEWYLIAYDIADPRRLQRLHRALRKEALAVQRSLYLLAGSVSRVEGLMDQWEALLDPQQDDLRAYPVEAPERLWLSGQRLLQGELVQDSVTDDPHRGTCRPDWRQRLAGQDLNLPQPPRMP